MLALQSPPRNLFSRRIRRSPAARNVVDYLDALRGTAPTWGVEGNLSPLWWAANELVEMQLVGKLKDQLLALTRVRLLRLDAPLGEVVAQYVADAAALGDQVDAVNRLFATVADSQTQMSAVIDPSPIYDVTDEGRFHVVGDNTARAVAQVESARARFARGLFAPKDAGTVLGPHLVTADFLAVHRDWVLAACQVDIIRRCEAAALHVQQCLIEGLASGLLGLVAWPAEDVCWYVRNERVLRLKGHWTQNTYEHWHVCKEVHLMDAMTLGGIPGWLEFPPPVRNVADAVPPILHPHLGTVIGTMIREREISWLAGEVTYPKDRVRPQRRLIIDPAIVIGSVVLTGWESPEHYRPGWWMQLDCALAWERAPVGMEAGS